MKEMTIQEILSLQLGMMQKIHDFCIANNVRSSLGGGTSLGDILHEGYIPRPSL